MSDSIKPTLYKSIERRLTKLALPYRLQPLIHRKCINKHKGIIHNREIKSIKAGLGNTSNSNSQDNLKNIKRNPNFNPKIFDNVEEDQIIETNENSNINSKSPSPSPSQKEEITSDQIQTNIDDSEVEEEYYVEDEGGWGTPEYSTSENQGKGFRRRIRKTDLEHEHELDDNIYKKGFDRRTDAMKKEQRLHYNPNISQERPKMTNTGMYTGISGSNVYYPQQQPTSPYEMGPQPPPPPGTYPGMAYAPQSSDISVLKDEEREKILAMCPTGVQAEFYSPGDLTEKIIWWGSAAGGCILLSKIPLLGALSLLSPLIGPWFLAALRNYETMSKSDTYCGIWHSKVLNVEAMSASMPSFDNRFQINREEHREKRQGSTLRLLIGDPWNGGARVEMLVPSDSDIRRIYPGDEVEVLVLSTDRDFVTFKAIREVFFPKYRTWLSEYPYIDKEEFYRISKAIEKEKGEQKDWEKS